MRMTSIQLGFTSCALSLLVACNGSDSSNQGALRFTTGQAASVVIGQPDFTSDGGSVTDSGFSELWGNPAYHNGKLYLPDYGGNRVLGFNGIPTSNGAAA